MQYSLPSGLLPGERPMLRRAFVGLINGADDRLPSLAASLLVRYAIREADALGLNEHETLILGNLAEMKNKTTSSEVVILQAIANRIAEPAELVTDTRLDERLDLLAEALELGTLDQAIAGVFARASVMAAWSGLLQAAAMGKSVRLSPITLAKVICRSQSDVERRYQLGMPIRRNGLVWRNGVSYEPGLLLFRIAGAQHLDHHGLRKEVERHARPVNGTSFSLERQRDLCGSGEDGPDVD